MIFWPEGNFTLSLHRCLCDEICYCAMAESLCNGRDSSQSQLLATCLFFFYHQITDIKRKVCVFDRFGFSITLKNANDTFEFGVVIDFALSGVIVILGGVGGVQMRFRNGVLYSHNYKHTNVLTTRSFEMSFKYREMIQFEKENFFV